MPPGVVPVLIGLALGIALAYFLGSEGGKDAILIALALVAGMAIVKFGVI